MKITVVVLLLVISQVVCGQQTSVDKPLDVGQLFIEGISSPSIEKQKKLIPQVFSETLVAEKGMDGLVKLFQDLRQMNPALVFHHTEINRFDKSTGAVYVMHVYAKNNNEVMWKDFQLYVDAPPFHRINKVAFIAEVAEPINLPNGSIQQQSTLDWLMNYIEKLKKENDLSGSILIAEGDKVLFEKYFGFADVERKMPVTQNTLFNMASGGKMFTALSIVKLIEAGKLKYDEPITKYLKGFSDMNKAEQVTIHHLLSHTSGVAEYWSGQDNDFFTAKAINDHLKMVYEVGFSFEAGSEYHYCNSNFILLGAVIENITGKSFYNFVKEEIFTPSGMVVSDYFNHGSKNTAIPLTRSENENMWKEAKHAIKGSSAGGSYSTCEDILKFSLALKSNLIVKAESFKKMTTPKNKELKSTEDYGYGFIIQKQAQEISYGHGGTAGGVNFEYRYFPNQDITLVIFNNQNNGAYDDLRKNVTKLITGER